MFCTRGSQVSLGREPQGSPSERCVVHSWEAAFGALIHLPEGTKWRTLLVSIAEQVVANAHFLSPTAPPPPKSTHHGCVILCWWVWDHLCSLALLCFWLPLRHMQWLSPTLPAYSLTCLGPSAFSFSPLLLYCFTPGPPVSGVWQGIMLQGKPNIRTHHLSTVLLTITRNKPSCQPFVPTLSQSLKFPN